MFGQDVKELGSGYGTLVHLIVFTVFTLVSFFLQKLVEVNFSIGPQISLFVYYLRMRWGWEEREVTRQLFFFIELIFLSFSLELLQWLQSCAVGRTSGC